MHTDQPLDLDLALGPLVKDVLTLLQRSLLMKNIDGKKRMVQYKSQRTGGGKERKRAKELKESKRKKEKPGTPSCKSIDHTGSPPT